MTLTQTCTCTCTRLVAFSWLQFRDFALLGGEVIPEKYGETFRNSIFILWQEGSVLAQ